MPIFDRPVVRAQVRSERAPSRVVVQEDGDLVSGDSSILNFTGDGVAVTESDGVVQLSITGTNIGSVDLEDINDVTITSVQNGQGIAWDPTTSMWINKTFSGGVTPPNPSKVSLSVSPTSVTEADSGTTTVTITVAAPSGYTLNSSEVTVTDTNNDPVTVTTVTAPTSYTFAADRTRVGNFQVTVTGHMTRNSDSMNVSDTETRNVPVNQEWFIATTTTQPTAVSSMTNQGVFTKSGDHDVTFTSAGNSGNNIRNAYVALPYASGNETYEFKLGVFQASTTNIATISTDYRLFRIDDFDDSQSSGSTLELSITETS